MPESVDADVAQNAVVAAGTTGAAGVAGSEGRGGRGSAVASAGDVAGASTAGVGTGGASTLPLRSVSRSRRLAPDEFGTCVFFFIGLLLLLQFVALFILDFW